MSWACFDEPLQPGFRLGVLVSFSSCFQFFTVGPNPGIFQSSGKATYHYFPIPGDNLPVTKMRLLEQLVAKIGEQAGFSARPTPNAEGGGLGPPPVHQDTPRHPDPAPPGGIAKGAWALGQFTPAPKASKPQKPIFGPQPGRHQLPSSGGVGVVPAAGISTPSPPPGGEGGQSQPVAELCTVLGRLGARTGLLAEEDTPPTPPSAGERPAAGAPPRPRSVLASASFSPELTSAGE